MENRTFACENAEQLIKLILSRRSYRDGDPQFDKHCADTVKIHVVLGDYQIYRVSHKYRRVKRCRHRNDRKDQRNEKQAHMRLDIAHQRFQNGRILLFHCAAPFPSVYCWDWQISL